MLAFTFLGWQYDGVSRLVGGNWSEINEREKIGGKNQPNCVIT